MSVLVAEFGAAALLAALALAVFAAGLGIWAGRRRDGLLARVAARSFYAAAAGVVLAAATLEAALLGHLFQLAFVTEHTDRSLPWPLLAAAFYGGQEGSMLYWTLVLTLLGAGALAAAGRAGIQQRAYATAVLALVASFFLVVLVFVASPFDLLEVTPPDGLGLNPVLRDGGMLIHPPFLLAGFSAFAIPFAFSMASLIAGRQDAAWISLTRRVALMAWGLQSTGLVLGMWWAYHVLGWGGYWGWDPVENLALLPWLATTAYIHSSQVQEARGQLRAWNHGLVVLAFLLSIFGTFVVRSGIVQSVHSFALSPIGPWFFWFLVVCVAGSGLVLAARAEGLRSERPLRVAASREGAFLLQNLLLAGLLAAILWGTVLPLVSGLFGSQRVVGPSYYERVGGPLLLALLALLAAGPLLPWRRAGRPWLRSLRWPGAAAIAALAVMVVLGARQPAALLAIPLAAAAAITAAIGLGRAGRFNAQTRRRYGAHLAHLGMVVLAAGIAGSHFWQQRFDVSLGPGEQRNLAGYSVTYQDSAQFFEGDHGDLVASLDVGGESLQPARLSYPGLGGQALTRVAIRSTPKEDLYIVLNGVAGGRASLTVFVNPLVTWIWAGAALLIVGVLVGNLGGLIPGPVGNRLRASLVAGAR